MNLYLIKRDNFDYDEYEGFVVAAVSGSMALRLAKQEALGLEWPTMDDQAQLIGTTPLPAGIVLASFHAG